MERRWGMVRRWSTAGASLLVAGFAGVASATVYLSPTALTASGDGHLLYIAEATANQVAAFSLAFATLAQRATSVHVVRRSAPSAWHVPLDSLQRADMCGIL